MALFSAVLKVPQIVPIVKNKDVTGLSPVGAATPAIPFLLVLVDGELVRLESCGLVNVVLVEQSPRFLFFYCRTNLTSSVYSCGARRVIPQASFYFDVLVFAIGTVYNVSMGYAFSTYGESQIKSMMPCFAYSAM